MSNVTQNGHSQTKKNGAHLRAPLQADDFNMSSWLRGVDLNHRPLGYEPNELPDCSTPRKNHNNRMGQRQMAEWRFLGTNATALLIEKPLCEFFR